MQGTPTDTLFAGIGMVFSGSDIYFDIPWPPSFPDANFKGYRLLMLTETNRFASETLGLEDEFPSGMPNFQVLGSVRTVSSGQSVSLLNLGLIYALIPGILWDAGQFCASDPQVTPQWLPRVW